MDGGNGGSGGEPGSKPRRADPSQASTCKRNAAMNATSASRPTPSLQARLLKRWLPLAQRYSRRKKCLLVLITLFPIRYAQCVNLLPLTHWALSNFLFAALAASARAREPLSD